jgi:hypothetical protein
MQKDSVHSDVVWSLCSELLTSSDPCLVCQGVATLRALLGIPGYRRAVVRPTSAKCEVGSALPHAATWTPAIRCIHAALQLLVLEHSDERVLQDVLASLQMLLAASFGGEIVIAVCGGGGPASDDKNCISLWQLVSRLTVLSLHPIPSLARDALVALSFLTCNAAGAAVCVLNRPASLLLWQVMCRCLQAISGGTTTADSQYSYEFLDGRAEQQIHVQDDGSHQAQDDGSQQLQDDGSQQMTQDDGSQQAQDDGSQQAQDDGSQQMTQDDGSQQAQDDGSQQLQDDGSQQMTQDDGSQQAQDDGSQQAQDDQLQQQISDIQQHRQGVAHTPSSHSAKTPRRRNFMSDMIHGRSEHSFVAGCNVTRDDHLLQPGVAELLLYCSMNACINCCTVSVSLKRNQSTKADLSSSTALFSCSFGCASYERPFPLISFKIVTLCTRYSFGPDGMIASDADVLSVFDSLLRYRLHSQTQFNSSLTVAESTSLPVLTALKVTPSQSFISQLCHPPTHSPDGDSAHTSAIHLLNWTNYSTPARGVAPFAAFVTEHYFVSILATQIVGASLRLQQGMAGNPTVRHAFFRSDIALSALRCLTFLAANIRLPHLFLRSDPASTSSSGVAASLRGFDTSAAGDCFRDSPQYRLQTFDTSRWSEAGDVSPCDLMSMMCDEHTCYVMTSTDVISSSESGRSLIKRCALGRMLLMEPFLINAVSFILHNASALEQLPRYAVVSSHALLGTRVDFGRCSGIVSASFCWDGPSVTDGGVRHHPSVFPFATSNAVDCELMCLSLLMSVVEGGHGWFTHSAGGGSQFYSARGCVLSLTNLFSRAASFMQKTQQHGTMTSSDALQLSLQQASLRGRAATSEPNAHLFDQPHTPRTPRSKRDASGDASNVSPRFTTNLQTESSALVMSQYVNLQHIVYLGYNRIVQVHFAPVLLD